MAYGYARRSPRRTSRRLPSRSRKGQSRYTARPRRSRAASSRRRSSSVKTVRIVIEQPGVNAVSRPALPLGQKQSAPAKNSRF